MLSKNLRLSRPDFLSVRSHGRNITGKYFSLVVNKHPQADNLPDRYAVVISQKVAKKATLRNHLRRIIYRAIADNLVTLGRDIIIYCRPPVINLSDEKICSQINSLLSKVPA